MYRPQGPPSPVAAEDIMVARRRLRPAPHRGAAAGVSGETGAIDTGAGSADALAVVAE
jgi:hypothetical protein